MALFRPRGSSIPRNYRQIPVEERFSVADAAQLKLKLQALDDKLESGVDVQVLQDACQSRPFHEEIYVDGSEEFFLLVKSITRADLIPKVYIEAYDTLQQGRYPLNHHRFSDFRKGVDPTFSEVRKLLGSIDELCGTKLDEFICALEDEGRRDPRRRSFPADGQQSNLFHFYDCRQSFDSKYTPITCPAQNTSPSCTAHLARCTATIDLHT